MKKLLSLTLFIILSFSIASAHGDHGSSFNNATALSLNTTVDGVLNSGFDTDTFSFTAKQSGLYIIQSLGDINTRGHLFNRYGEYIDISDDDGTGANFAFYLKMNAGEKIFIKVDQVDWLPGAYKINVMPFELSYDHIETGASSIEKQLLDEQDFNIAIPLKFFKNQEEVEPPTIKQGFMKVQLADQTPCNYALDGNNLILSVNRPVDTHVVITYGLNQQISIPIHTYLVSEDYVIIKKQPPFAQFSVSSSETIANCYVVLNVSISPTSSVASGTLKINYDRNRLTLIDDNLMALYSFAKGLLGDKYSLSRTSSSLLRKLNNGELPPDYKYNLISLVRKIPDEIAPPEVTSIGNLLSGYDTDLNTGDRSTRKTIYYSFAGDKPLEDSGEILKLVFLVNDSTYTGTTTVNMETILLSDINSNPIDYDISNGEVVIRDYFMGDVKIDGVINEEDVAEILAHSVYNKRLTTKQKRAADVNDDNEVDANDALMILLYLNGHLDTLEPQ